MKTSRLALLFSLAALALAGCSSATQISGAYQTPQGNLAASVGFATNGVDLSGSYTVTNQAVSGAIDINK